MIVSPLFFPHIQRISAKRPAKYHRHITSLEGNETGRVSRNLCRVGGLDRSSIRGILLHGAPPSMSDNEKTQFLFRIAISLPPREGKTPPRVSSPRRGEDGPKGQMRGQALRISLPSPPHPAAATFSPSGRRNKLHPPRDIEPRSSRPQRLKISPKTSICLTARTTSAISATACGTARSHTGE